MVSFRNMFSKLLVNSFLKRVLVMLGCLLFLFSFIFPFFYARWIPALPLVGGGSWSTYYWSFKIDERNVDVLSQLHGGQDWFSGYWFSDYEFTFDVGGGILILMLTIQLLTLAVGLVSIRFDRRDLLFAPVMLSLAVAVLMTYIGGEISGDSLAISTEYQLGYYLVYPSIAMFLFAFLLNEVTRN